MKKIFKAENIAEAHMLKDLLKERGIASTIEGEHSNVQFLEPIAVWVDEEEDGARAREIISEFFSETVEEGPAAAPVGRASSKSAFWTGVVLGALGCAFAAVIYNSATNTAGPRPDGWDMNSDGQDDRWAEYTDGEISKYIYDRNYDGVADQWLHYQKGLIRMRECDYNFDGMVDDWEYFKNGQLYKYHSDNDRDGEIDEWGVTENNQIKERLWSFNNDRTIDNKAVYTSGRKEKVLYDRDRDGEFDEEVVLDAFERVVKTERRTQ